MLGVDDISGDLLAADVLCRFDQYKEVVTLTGCPAEADSRQDTLVVS